MIMRLWSVTEGEPRKRWGAAMMTTLPVVPLLPQEALGILYGTFDVLLCLSKALH